jgi:hypothetical protein
MRPLSFFELLLVMIIAILVLLFLTVGFPRKDAVDPCVIVQRKSNVAQEYKDSCKNLKELYRAP